MSVAQVRDDRHLGILMYAINYFASALVVHERFSEKPLFVPGSPTNPVHISSDVAYFLLGHAVELCLKAMLVHFDSSVGERRLRDLGHDLDKCQKAVKELSPNFLGIWDDADVAGISLLNDVYMKKEFEYIRTGVTRRVDWNAIQNAAARLFREIRREIPDSVTHFRSREGRAIQKLMESV